MFMYEVSSDGIVRNIKSKKILKCYIDKDGYKRYTFNNKAFGSIGKGEHQLVLESWGPDKPEWANQIDHIDRNKLNNNISNLRWANNLTNASNRDYIFAPQVREKLNKCLTDYIKANTRKVVMQDKNGIDIMTFESSLEAAKYIKISYPEYKGTIETIARTIRDSKHYAYKHKWKFINNL